MKNHSLSKYRMIQILSVLALLTSVFTWRTYQYNELINVQCTTSPNCTIMVLNQKITISMLNIDEPQEIRTYKIDPVLKSWQYTTNGTSEIRHNNPARNLPLEPDAQAIYLTIPKEKNLYIELNKTVKITIRD
jgi:sensor domain CHASE-containing protein